MVLSFDGVVLSRANHTHADVTVTHENRRSFPNALTVYLSEQYITINTNLIDLHVHNCYMQIIVLCCIVFYNNVFRFMLLLEINLILSYLILSYLILSYLILSDKRTPKIFTNTTIYNFNININVKSAIA